MKINASHPRAWSLSIREKLVKGIETGITSTAGLIAHGRGEAFDYLLGEKTLDFSKKATIAAAAYLLLAKHPILSINGNTAALVRNEFIELARLLNCKIEVNLFHYSAKRIRVIEKALSQIDSQIILRRYAGKLTKLPYIKSARKFVISDGIAKSDVVFVPLEDGDRTQALVQLGKKVITVDLNPLSRTAKDATVTIVDHVVRALPHLTKTVEILKHKPRRDLESTIRSYNNQAVLSKALIYINKRLQKLSKI